MSKDESIQSKVKLAPNYIWLDGLFPAKEHDPHAWEWAIVDINLIDGYKVIKCNEDSGLTALAILEVKGIENYIAQPYKKFSRLDVDALISKSLKARYQYETHVSEKSPTISNDAPSQPLLLMKNKLTLESITVRSSKEGPWVSLKSTTVESDHIAGIKFRYNETSKTAAIEILECDGRKVLLKIKMGNLEDAEVLAKSILVDGNYKPHYKLI